MSSRLKWRTAAPLGLLLIAGAALAGCSSSKSAPTAGPSASATATTPAPTAAPRSDVAVTLKDFGVAAAPASVPAGKVTFAVQNSGPSPHEFLIVKSDVTPGSLPQVNQKIVDEKQVQVVGKAEAFDGGSKRELTAELQPGRYVLLCNVPSHYVSGMYTAFTVTVAQ